MPVGGGGEGAAEAMRKCYGGLGMRSEEEKRVTVSRVIHLCDDHDDGTSRPLPRCPLPLPSFSHLPSSAANSAGRPRRSSHRRRLRHRHPLVTEIPAGGASGLYFDVSCAAAPRQTTPA